MTDDEVRGCFLIGTYASYVDDYLRSETLFRDIGLMMTRSRNFGTKQAEAFKEAAIRGGVPRSVLEVPKPVLDMLSEPGLPKLRTWMETTENAEVDSAILMKRKD